MSDKEQSAEFWKKEALALVVLLRAKCSDEEWASMESRFEGECTAPAPQPPMDRLPLLVDAVQKFLKHDGGPGSEDYNASEIYHARRSMQAAFGFRCPRCGETLPHLYDENCTDYRGEICERQRDSTNNSAISATDSQSGASGVDRSQKRRVFIP